MLAAQSLIKGMIESGINSNRAELAIQSSRLSDGLDVLSLWWFRLPGCWV